MNHSKHVFGFNEWSSHSDHKMFLENNENQMTSNDKWYYSWNVIKADYWLDGSDSSTGKIKYLSTYCMI